MVKGGERNRQVQYGKYLYEARKIVLGSEASLKFRDSKEYKMDI